MCQTALGALGDSQKENFWEAGRGTRPLYGWSVGQQES